MENFFSMHVENKMQEASRINKIGCFMLTNLVNNVLLIESITKIHLTEKAGKTRFGCHLRASFGQECRENAYSTCRS